MNTLDDLLTSHLLTNCSTNEPQDLVQKAMGAVTYLIAKFADNPTFYQNVGTSTLERWMVESFPEVVRKLRESDKYEDFERQLDGYREKLALAAASAYIALKHGTDNPFKSDASGHHRIFSGLMACVATGHYQMLDEQQVLEAILIDRHIAEFARTSDHIPMQATVYHPDTPVDRNAWDRCDMEKAEAAGLGVAHLVPRDHLPRFAEGCTSEEFALLVRVPPEVPFELLDATHPLDAASIGTDTANYERSLVLGGCPILLPMRANQDILNLFRNRLAILYAHDAGCVFVEYPWNPVTDFLRNMYSWDETYYLTAEPPEEIVHDSNGFHEQHPHTIRISEVRPMPILEGPNMSKRQQDELFWAMPNLQFRGVTAQETRGDGHPDSLDEIPF
ncbi:hypothetical protein [Paraburkholderia caribensis]|uniref:hypothetical protein n=1 Tax=Paraburkholderia caribensis TaxID=75105 RepID=UPI0031D5A587